MVYDGIQWNSIVFDFILWSSLVFDGICGYSRAFVDICGYLLVLGPEPAFGRLGLDGSLGGYSSHGYTSHASLRAHGAQLGGNSCSSEDLQNIFDIIYFKQG